MQSFRCQRAKDEIHAALGDKNRAFVWLDKAYYEHNVRMVYLKVNPFSDSLREDARFDDAAAARRTGPTAP
jgi:hypothetical protein